MRSNVQEYDLIAPSSLNTVLQMLADEPGALTPIAGGTELMVALAAGRLTAHRLVSLNGIRELRFIKEDHDHIVMGAASTFTDIRRHVGIRAKLPLLSEAAGWVGGIANQNRGTLGGNLANASPAADSSPALLVYDAEIDLISASGTRSIPYREFHLGYKKTALRPDELIHSLTVRVPQPVGPSAPVSYIRKVGTRNAMAISKTVLAGIAWVEDDVIQDLRLAAASLAPTPIRLFNTERALVGQSITPDTVRAARAALAAESAPIDDIRSTAQYRSAVAANLLVDFLTICRRPQT